MAKEIPAHLKDRLPPGQVYTDKWPVLHEGSPLDFNPATWRLKVHGEVANPLELTWEEFQTWPQAEVKSDFHCVTTWSNFDNLWGGVLFSTLLEKAQPKPEAKFVRFADHQGYDTSLPLEVASEPNVILATHWKGEAIGPDHGGPMRAIVPSRYAWKSCKWLIEVEFLAKDRLGYWEVRGYHNNGEPFAEERFS